jgi:hypothetical protein
VHETDRALSVCSHVVGHSCMREENSCPPGAGACPLLVEPLRWSAMQADLGAGRVWASRGRVRTRHELIDYLVGTTQ